MIVEFGTPGNIKAWTISWKHLRRDGNNQTLCIIRDSNKEVMANEIAVCSSKDNFSKFIGRKVSFTKAIQGFSRAERKYLWERFWQEPGNKDKRNAHKRNS